MPDARLVPSYAGATKVTGALPDLYLLTRWYELAPLQPSVTNVPRPVDTRAENPMHRSSHRNALHAAAQPEASWKDCACQSREACGCIRLIDIIAKRMGPRCSLTSRLQAREKGKTMPLGCNTPFEGVLCIFTPLSSALKSQPCQLDAFRRLSPPGTESCPWVGSGTESLMYE